MYALPMLAILLLNAMSSDPTHDLLKHSQILPTIGQADLGVDSALFSRTVDFIWLEQCKESQKPWKGMTPDDVAQLSSQVANNALKILTENYKANVSGFGQSLMRAESVSAWVTLWITRNTEIDERLARGENVDTVSSSYPRFTLATDPPMAVCSGYALVLRDALRKLGMESNVLQGRFRNFDGFEAGHCWTSVNLGGGIWLPSDATTPVRRSDVLRHGGKLRGFGLLPRTKAEIAVYHAKYYNWSPVPKSIAMFGDNQKSQVMLSMTEVQWRSLDVSSLKRIESQLSGYR